MPATIVPILASEDYAQEIGRGAALLSAGKLLVLPTETIYGVAGVLSNAQARAALGQLRQAQAATPFTVHLARRQDAGQFLGQVNDFAQRMMRKLWPGPVGLTMDVPEAVRREVNHKWGLAPGELYQGESVTLRCPDHPVFFDVVCQLKEPVALTSAGGEHHRLADLPGQVLSRVDLALDAGETRFAKPSTLLRVRKNSYELVRAGVYDARIIDRLLHTTILFVCSGNTCRSPMAEAIARQYLAQRLGTGAEELESRGISVMSAGSYALAGAAATGPAVEALRQMGLDISRHRARPLSVELIHQADMIYTMSRTHARVVTELVPAAADRVLTLDPQHDIEDPIGGDIALYVQVAQRLKTMIEQRLQEGVVPGLEMRR